MFHSHHLCMKEKNKTKLLFNKTFRTIKLESFSVGESDNISILSSSGEGSKRICCISKSVSSLSDSDPDSVSDGDGVSDCDSISDCDCDSKTDSDSECDSVFDFLSACDCMTKYVKMDCDDQF